jgi:L-threonylcarbamoyladenylate synthase
MCERSFELKTKYWPEKGPGLNRAALREASDILKKGGVVAFPTETVYGLGADGLSPYAVRRIFKAKRRPADNPLILHVAGLEQLEWVAVNESSQTRLLIQKFWPGPLTLVLPKTGRVPYEVTAGLDTVAVRMPDHPLALALIGQTGVPLAAPSANRSGYPSPTTAAHVLHDLDGRVHGVLDGGACRIGLESTILDLTQEVPMILRPGAITKEALEQVLGAVAQDPGLAGSADSEGSRIPKAPGLKYRHYAPEAKVCLLSGTPEEMAGYIRERARDTDFLKENGPVGLLLTEETAQALRKTQWNSASGYVRVLGSRSRLSGIGERLYDELRRCDVEGLRTVFAETYPLEGVGAALMNRLAKASGQVP